MIKLLVVVIAICAAAVRAVPSLGTPLPELTTEPPESVFDLEKEKNGHFTSEWTPNTMKCFKRVDAIVEICLDGMEYFARYADEDPTQEEHPQLYTLYESPRRKTWCYLKKQHLRDSRNFTSMPLARDDVIFIKSSNESEEAYALSKEVVWQLEIPRGYGAFLTMRSFNVPKPDYSTQCIDYVSVHFHPEEGKDPIVLCGHRNDVNFLNIKASKLTIKFVSDESDNHGGFRGGLLIYPAGLLIRIINSGMNAMSMMGSRSKRYMRDDGSGMPVPARGTKISAFELSPQPGTSDDCDDDDSDCDTTEPRPEPATFEPDGMPNFNAMWCFSDIVENGIEAAVKHLLDSPSSQCRKFAEIFLQDDYAAPT